MSESWIDVNDQLPPINTKVLVYIIGDADPEVNVSYWDEKDDAPDEDGDFFVRWYYEGFPMYETSWWQKVTHWMPIPDGPTIK